MSKEKVITPSKLRYIPSNFMSAEGVKWKGRLKKHFGHKHPKMTNRQVRDMVRRYFRSLSRTEAETWALTWDLGEHIAIVNGIDIMGYARGLNFPILRQIWNYFERSKILEYSKVRYDKFYVSGGVRLRRGANP